MADVCPHRMAKIAIIGAGNVGGACALYLTEHELVLVDVVDGVAEGKALDLREALALRGGGTVVGTQDFSAIAGAEIVVVTAGMPRRDGMTRDDLIRKNYPIMQQVTGEIKRHAPSSVVIIVSNPVDVMTYAAQQLLGFPKQRVIGVGGVLDHARFRTVIAQMWGISPKQVQTMVIGSHNETMVPLVSQTTVNGKPLHTLC